MNNGAPQPGELATGGGYSGPNSSTIINVRVTTSEPLPLGSGTPTGWRVSVINDNTSGNPTRGPPTESAVRGVP